MLHQVRAVAAAKKRRDAAKQSAVVIAPGDPRSALEGGQGFRLVELHGGRHLQCRRKKAGACFVGEDQGLFGRQSVFTRGRVIDYVVAGGLATEPFARVTLVAAGPRGDFMRAEKAGAGHRAVEPQLMAQVGHEPRRAGGEVADQPLQKILQFLLVDGGSRMGGSGNGGHK